MMSGPFDPMAKRCALSSLSTYCAALFPTMAQTKPSRYPWAMPLGTSYKRMAGLSCKLSAPPEITGTLG